MIAENDKKNVVHVKRADFERMYKTMKITAMAKELGVSTGAIYRRLDELKIRRVGAFRLVIE